MSYSAGDFKVTLAQGTIGLCFSISLCITPRATGTASRAATRLNCGIKRVTGAACTGQVGTEAFKTGGNKALGTFLARSTGFEGAADGAASFSVGMGPNGKANAIICDGVARGWFRRRSGRRSHSGVGMGEHTWRAKISGRGPRKRIICIWIIESGSRGPVICGGHHRSTQ